MNHFSKILIFCLIGCLCQNIYAEGSSSSGSITGASGQIYSEETFFPLYVKKNDGSGVKDVATESGMGLDFRTTLGYVAWDTLLLGLTYNYYHIGTSRAMTAADDGLHTLTDKKEFGPTVGVLFGSFRFAVTYFVYATNQYWEQHTDPSTNQVSLDEIYRNTSGSGYQLALGYGLNLGSMWTIGPTLLYRNVTYAHQNHTVNAGTPSTGAYNSSAPMTKAIDPELKPMITVIFRFL